MEELIKYYTNLLILQYKNKTKAKATIGAIVENAFAGDDTVTKDGIFPLQVENAYDLDKAVGKQLDTIGKYLGFDRTVRFIVDNNFKYQEYDDSNPITNGYNEYEQEVSSYPYKEYRFDTYTDYSMQDDLYRKVLKFIIFIRDKNMSYYAISEGLYQAFGDDLYAIEGDKTLVYHFGPNANTFQDDSERNAFINKFMPHPMGVAVTQVKDEESSSI